MFCEKIQDITCRVITNLFFWLCLTLVPPILNIIALKVGMVSVLDDQYLVKAIELFNEGVLYWTVAGLVYFFIFSMVVYALSLSIMRLLNKPAKGWIFPYSIGEISSQLINFGSIIIAINIYIILINELYVGSVKVGGVDGYFFCWYYSMDIWHFFVLI